MLVFDDSPALLLQAGGEGPSGDLERALVRFLEARGEVEDAARR
jgi:hypothetical protein